jgi:hypothetical protein
MKETFRFVSCAENGELDFDNDEWAQWSLK